MEDKNSNTDSKMRVPPVEESKEKSLENELDYQFHHTERKTIDVTQGNAGANSTGNHLPPTLDMKYVNRFRWILFASNFCVNIDMGILPACTLKMSKELSLETAEFGGLGSIVYVGQAVGCVIAAVMF